MSEPAGGRTPARAFLREVGLLIGLPIVAAVVIFAWGVRRGLYAVPAGSSVFAVASGTWDWSTAKPDSFCVISRHRIDFSADHWVMTITQAIPWTEAGVPESVAVYDISESSDHHIRGQIRGETRKTPSGKPVVWDLELTSDSSYSWHRTDWLFFTRTAPIRRCPAPRGGGTDG